MKNKHSTLFTLTMASGLLLLCQCNLDKVEQADQLRTFETQFGDIGNIEENGSDVIQLRNGEGYIVVGDQEKQANGDRNGIILKFGLDGILVDSYTLSDQNVGLSKVGEDDAGNIIAIGSSYTGTTEDYDLCLVKLNANLDLIYYKKFNRNAGFSEYGTDLIMENDGYLVLGRVLTTSPSNDNTWLLKINTNGQLSSQYLDDTPEYDHGEAFVRSDDNNIVVAGQTGDRILLKEYFSNLTPTSKFNTFGGAGTLNIAYGIVRNGSKGYALTGQETPASNIPDLYFLRVDKNFFLEDEHTYGEPDLYDFGQSIVQTPDGNFVLAGRQMKSGNFISVLIKVDETGQVNWQESYDPYGFYAVANTRDGGLIATGTVLNTTDNETDIYLVKTDEKGKQQ